MKAIKIVAAAMALNLFAIGAATAQARFSDVNTEDNCFEAVEELSSLGIIDGFDNGLFKPSEKLTRAQMTKLIVTAKNLTDEAASQRVFFTDVTNSKNSWALGYVAAAKTNGLIDGTSETTFSPNTAVTYEQAAKMLVNACGYDEEAKADGGWPSGYINCMNKLNINQGLNISDTSAHVTRGDAAILLMNAMKTPLSGDNESAKTILTENHNIYEVFGRLENDGKNILFTIENSDNFKDEKISSPTEIICTSDENLKSSDSVYALISDDLKILYQTSEYKKHTATSSSSQPYAIADRFFLSEGKIKVKLITADGSEKNYTLSEDNRSELGLDYLDLGDIKSFISLGLTDEKSASRFVKYKVNSDNTVTLEKISSDDIMLAENQSFSADKLGAYSISDSATVLDASTYSMDSNAHVTKISKSSFANKGQYSAAFLGKDDESGEYSLIVVLSGMANGYSVDTGIVIAKSSSSTVKKGSSNIYCLDVLSNSGEMQLFSEKQSVFASIKEGTSFIYSTENDMVTETVVLFDADNLKNGSDPTFDCIVGETKSDEESILNNIGFYDKENDNQLCFILAPVYENNSQITIAAELEAILDCPKIEHTYTSACGPGGLHQNCGQEAHVHSDKCPHKSGVSEAFKTYSYDENVTAVSFDLTAADKNKVKTIDTSEISTSVLDTASYLSDNKIWFENPKNVVNYALIRIYDNKVKEIVSIKTAK